MIPSDAGAILVVRLTARGDVVLSSPLAGALRRCFPDARIAWAVEEHTADVMRHNPHLDEVIVWERAEWKRLLRTGRWGAFLGAAVDFFGELRDRRFDVAIDAQGLLRSGALAFFSGAPTRIGLGSREGSRLLMTRVVKREPNTRRIASADAAFARALGLDTSSFAMEIPRGADDLATVDRIVEEEGLGDGFAAACPFTTRSYKHWFEDRWSALIRGIREKVGLGVVLLGGPADRAGREPDPGRGRERAGGGCAAGGPGGPHHAGRGVRRGLAMRRAGRAWTRGSVTWRTRSAARRCCSSDPICRTWIRPRRSPASCIRGATARRAGAG